MVISQRGDGDRFPDEQDSVIIFPEQTTFCGKVGDVCGFRLRMRGHVVAKSEEEGVETAELKLATSRVAQGFRALGSFPVTGAVAQQGV